MQDNQNMRLTNVFAIRDARGLTREEKLFLFVVESRGVYTRSAVNAHDEMAMGRKLFDKTRDSLEGRSLLFVKRFPRRGRATPTNHYTVNMPEVVKLIPQAEAVASGEWTTGLASMSVAENDVLAARDRGALDHVVVPSAHVVDPVDHEIGPRGTTKRTTKKTSQDDQEANLEAERAASPQFSQDCSRSSSPVLAHDPGVVDPHPLADAAGPAGSQGGGDEMRVQRMMAQIRRGNLAVGVTQDPSVTRRIALGYLAKQDSAREEEGVSG